MITDDAKSKVKEYHKKALEYAKELQYMMNAGVCPHCTGEISVAKRFSGTLEYTCSDCYLQRLKLPR